MLKKILIANRGEIACRIINTCREMGIKTVSVFSEVDREAMHVLAADQAVCLGQASPAESYLNMEKIINAARETGAEAIHPGYGFLAENADFAARCVTNGIVFIGPPARVISNLGDKTVARSIMVKSGVPVIPGMMQTEPDIKILAAEAQEIGYPILIKAAAGGGGKGMRVIKSPEEVEDACMAASSEAEAAFGSNAIYLEKFIEKPRHIEFQILADTFGNVIHLLERECSIQRRYQKIIEETPSPVLTPVLRNAMGEAAVAAAKAAGYVNAGTVEFLLDQEGKFYFLEVNTRLQVEHPITEMITGIDIVRQQIEIAAGKKLSLGQDNITGRGHAIECRVYAEDPEKDFFPSPGKIVFMKEPTGPGVRNDCGVYTGFEVPVDYDPIISKLIVHAENRDKAIAKMIKSLHEYIILGVKTPIPYLIDVLKSNAFGAGETYTDFITTHFSEWKQECVDTDLALIAYLIDEISEKPKFESFAPDGRSIPEPWETLGNWRL